MPASPLDPEELRPHLDRFLAYVDRTGDCWTWRGASRNNGYCSMMVNGRRVGAHRFSYTVWREPIPPGLEIDHLCRDRACVNPEHLELVTRAENLLRRNTVTPGSFSSWVPLLQRIKSRLDVTKDGCWLWTGALVRGYGVLSVNGRTEYVHRELWRLTVGPLDGGMTLDHLCRNTRCCRPDHLEMVSRAENARRANETYKVGKATRLRRPKRNATHCRHGHEYAIYGRPKHGQCRACGQVQRGFEARPFGAPRHIRDRTHCGNGHEYVEVGRYPSGGCRACQRQKDLARRKGPRPPKQFCPAGHDVFAVGRRDGNGECRECSRKYARKKYGYSGTQEALNFACRNGHLRTYENTREIKRIRNGKMHTERLCLDCRAVVLQRYAEKRLSG